MKNQANLLELTHVSGETVLINWSNVTWVIDKEESNQKVSEIAFLAGGPQVLLCRETTKEIKELLVSKKLIN